MDRYPKHLRDGQESYREQSHSFRNLRRPEGGRKTDKPTPSAQSSDDFVTSAMKSIFGEDDRDPYETSGSRARNDAHEDDLGTDYRDPYETSGSRDHNSSARSCCDYVTQLAAGVMRWMLSQVSDSSGHGDYDNKDAYPYSNQEYIYDSDPQHINSNNQYGTAYNNIPRSASHDSTVESSDHLDIQYDATHNKKNDLKSLFSSNQIRNDLKSLFSSNRIEKETAEQKVVTRSYLEKWKNEKQRPKSPEFEDIYLCARNVLENPNIQLKDLLRFFKLTDWSSQNLFRILEHINKEFQSFAAKDINNHLEQEAEELIEWAKTFRKRFDLREDWVQAGMKQQLGIESRYFLESCRQPPMGYEQLVVAHAKLKSIRELLEDGIPVEGIPERIKGRKVTEVSGRGNDCLIRALLKGANPKWRKDLLEENVTKMRNQLIGVKEGTMLDLTDQEGKQLIQNMKEAQLIKSDRDILAYRYYKGKIQCFQITDEKSNKPPYAVLLYHEIKHFYAIEVPY